MQNGGNTEQAGLKVCLTPRYVIEDYQSDNNERVVNMLDSWSFPAFWIPVIVQVPCHFLHQQNIPILSSVYIYLSKTHTTCSFYVGMNYTLDYIYLCTYDINT